MTRQHLVIFISLITLLSHRATAQEGYIPPRPPPMEAPPDFEEMDDDLMEVGGEDQFRPPPVPNMPVPGSGSPIPPPDFRPPGGGSSFSGGGGGFPGGKDAKVKFKLVEGEYWEKGQKRVRGQKPGTRPHN